jgi:phosphatidylserine decarboxylase
VLITAWIAYFFRDPPRVTPLREGLIIAPGDGRISAIEVVRPPAELGFGDEPRLRISIFLSVFDVHINRAPVPGRVVRSVYVPGTFLNAGLDKASEEKERRCLVISTSGQPGGRRGADRRPRSRRIVTFIREGDTCRRRRALWFDPLRLARGHLSAARARGAGGASASARWGETILADLQIA